MVLIVIFKILISPTGIFVIDMCFDYKHFELRDERSCNDVVIFDC